MKKSLIKKGTGNEWLEFISQMGMVNLSQARSIFISGDYSHLTDAGQRALYTAGRGKALSLQGNLLGSKLSFDEAHIMAETRNAESGFPARDEILAYVYFERGGFFNKYGEVFNSLSFYRNARRLAESTNLIKTIDYQLFMHDFEKGKRGDLSEALDWITYFKDNNMQIMHLISQRRIASYFRLRKDYPNALKWIDIALASAHNYGHAFMVDQFRNLKGYILYFMGDVESAREIYHDLIPRVESYYLKSIVLENLTLTYAQEGNFDAAGEFIEEAITNSQSHEILSRMPAECLFMGGIQRDHFMQPELASFYFEEGYHAALRMSELGFTLNGDRLNVVKAFEGRTKSSYSIPERTGKAVAPFEFALGRAWKEILDLFHFTLLKSHLMAGDGSADLPEKLGLKTSTYYAIKRRLGSVGYDFDPSENRLPVAIKNPELSAFSVYVGKLQDLSWADANGQFESEIIEFLFKHAGYQKTKLAEDLDISYPTVLQKTKSLTMSD